jgi:ribosomal protein L29
MKGKDLNELTKEELLKKKKDAKEELFNLIQHSTGQLELYQG